jgi:hypothetical protein
MKQAYTIKSLHAAMQNDLTMCNSNFERGMVKAVCGKEIREKAQALAAAGKLSANDARIAAEFGFRGKK